MIVTSTVAMYIMMYLNTYEADHIEFSQTRLWMAIVTGAGMAIIMLGFMFAMYPNKRANLAIILGSVAVFALSLWLARSQATVYDVAYLKGMIPDHSIVIMTSERAHIRDARVRKLADGIIHTQVKEIGEMKHLIWDLRQHPVPANARDLPPDRADNAGL